MRTTRGLKAVMDANGGDIPNKLYLEKNERLRKMIEDFTDVQPPADATTKDLVNQILDIIKNTKVEIPLEAELTEYFAGFKRKADDAPAPKESKTDAPAPSTSSSSSSTAPAAAPAAEVAAPVEVAGPQPKKGKKPQKPRWLLEELDPLNIAEMKRMLHVPPEDMYKRYQAGDLMLMWNAMGMKTEYPMGSWVVGKDDNIQKMRLFAARNLTYHNIN